MVIVIVDVQPVEGRPYCFKFCFDSYTFLFTNFKCVQYSINGGRKDMLHKNAYVSYTYPVYQGPEENNQVVGFIGKCNTLLSNQYYFDTTGFLAASLTPYIFQKETSEIVTIPNVVTSIEVPNEVENLDAVVSILPHIKKSAFADLTPEDVEPITMDLVIFNKTNYMLHSTRMYPAFDCVSKHIGYFNTVCDNYGIFVTLEQCHKHQQFQEKIVQKAVRNKLR